MSIFRPNLSSLKLLLALYIPTDLPPADTMLNERDSAIPTKKQWSVSVFFIPGGGDERLIKLFVATRRKLGVRFEPLNVLLQLLFLKGEEEVYKRGVRRRGGRSFKLNLFCFN